LKTYFVVNPVSGTGQGKDGFIRQIQENARNLGMNIEIYQTQSSGDAERFVFETVTELKAEEARIYICGGDGTFNEAINGLMKAKEALQAQHIQADTSLGLVPIGSGNDFIKNFWSVDGARSIDAQLHASPLPCDVLEFTTETQEGERVRYCANMFNIGFDCNTADLANHLKEKPLISGHFAYLLGVLGTLIKKKGANIRVEVDGELFHEGPALLCSLANGPYCGGGVKSNPGADVQDGVMDVNVVRNISRLGLLKLFPSYQKGVHMQLPNIEKTIRTAVCREAVITPLQGQMRLCTDGEITDEGKIRIRVIQHGFSFLGPAKS